jgi:hypothetical protein
MELFHHNWIACWLDRISILLCNWAMVPARSCSDGSTYHEGSEHPRFVHLHRTVSNPPSSKSYESRFYGSISNLFDSDTYHGGTDHNFFSINGAVFLMIYYLPIYFQAIDGVSPAESGVRCVPLILAMSIALLMSSAIVTKIGYFHPLLLVGGICMTIGSGLIYTLDIGSSTGSYIGYQVITGFGNGICSQIPLIASIAFSKPEDIPLTTALVLCMKTKPPFSFILRLTWDKQSISLFPVHSLSL